MQGEGCPLRREREKKARRKRSRQVHDHLLARHRTRRAPRRGGRITPFSVRSIVDLKGKGVLGFRDLRQSSPCLMSYLILMLHPRMQHGAAQLKPPQPPPKPRIIAAGRPSRSKAALAARASSVGQARRQAQLGQRRRRTQAAGGLAGAAGGVSHHPQGCLSSPRLAFRGCLARHVSPTCCLR
jgi:hypothetical protein